MRHAPRTEGSGRRRLETQGSNLCRKATETRLRAGAVPFSIRQRSMTRRLDGYPRQQRQQQWNLLAGSLEDAVQCIFQEQRSPCKVSRQRRCDDAWDATRAAPRVAARIQDRVLRWRSSGTDFVKSNKIQGKINVTQVEEWSGPC